MRTRCCLTRAALALASLFVVGCSTDLPGPTASPGVVLPGGVDAVEVVDPPDIERVDIDTLDIDTPDVPDSDTAEAPVDTAADVDRDDHNDALDTVELVDTSDADMVGVDLGIPCSTDADCDDNLPCNGAETCSPVTSTCVDGAVVPVDAPFCRDATTSVTCDGAGLPDTPLECPLGCNDATGACREKHTVTVGADSTADIVAAVEDVSFDEDTPTTNSDSGVNGSGHRITTDSFIWLRVDLSALPPGAQLAAATLELYSTTIANAGEGARTTPLALGADTVPARDWVQSQATWLQYDADPAHLWTSGGGAGDRGATIATVDVPADIQDVHVAWPFDAVGVAAVAARMGTDTPLVLTLWGASAGHDRQYIPAEGPDGQRPRLTLDYAW